MVKFFTSDDLEHYQPREFIELIGHPKSGKSYAILCLAEAWKRLHPDRLVYILDTEDGIKKTWKQAFPGVDNIRYLLLGDMDSLILALDEVKARLNSQDWLCVESLSRIWEYSQNLGYEAITGMTKAQYLEKRIADKKGPVTPQPDQLWQIVKNAYQRNFMDVIVNEIPCHVLLTTTLSKERGFESQARREVRMSLGLNVSPDGDPRNPYYPDTVVLMTKEPDGFWATVLGDRGNENPGEQIRFKVENFLLDFMDNCRRGRG